MLTNNSKFFYVIIVSTCLVFSLITNLMYLLVYEREVNNGLESNIVKRPIDRILKNDARLLRSNENIQSDHSSFHCIGSRNESHPHERALCHFRNICYDRSSNQFTYYEGDSIFRQPKYFLNRPMTDQFPNIYDLRNGKYKINIRKGAIPKHLPFTTEKLTVFSQAFNVDNFGHLIADNMFPIFHALNELQLWDPNELRVIWPDFDFHCQNGKGAGREKMREGCIKQTMKTMIGSGFTNYKPWEMADLKNRTVCFKNLVLGVGQYAYSRYIDSVHGSGQGSSWKDFRDFLRYSIAGIEQTESSRMQQILVIKREGMRRAINHGEMISAIRKLVPGIKVVESSLASLSLAEQVKLISNSTVIVTPSGGISFASLFASDETSVIYFNYWIPSLKTSKGMDQWFFQKIPFLRVFQYHIENHNEVRLELDNRSYRWLVEGSFKVRTDRKYRLGGSVKIVPKRLAPLLYWALRSLVDSGAAKPFDDQLFEQRFKSL